jgi:hypothetical protein
MLENRLTDGGEGASLRRRPIFTLRKIAWHLHMCVCERERLSRPKGYSTGRRILSIENSFDLKGNRISAILLTAYYINQLLHHPFPFNS